MSEIFGDNYQGSTLITDTTHSQTMANTTGETVTAAMWSYLLDEVRGIQEVLGVPGRRGAAGKVSGSDTSVGTATASGTNLVFAATQTALTTGSLVSTATPSTHGWRRVVTSGGITCTVDSAFDDTITSLLIYRHGTLSERVNTIETLQEYVGPWTSYSPATQGLGTLSGVNAYYRQNGTDSIDIRVDATTGTTTWDEAQFGLPSGITCGSQISTNTILAGILARNTMSPFISVLATSGDPFLNFARTNTGTVLTPLNGINVFGNSERFSFYIYALPVNGL